MISLFLTIILGIIALYIVLAAAPLLLILGGIGALCLHQAGWGCAMIIAGCLWAKAATPA